MKIMFCTLHSNSTAGARLLRAALILLSLAVAKPAPAQTGAKDFWETDNGGSVVAYSADGQLLLAGSQLFAASDGTFVRNFVLPYNGGGPNSVAFSPDRQYAAIGIQGFNQNLDLF